MKTSRLLLISLLALAPLLVQAQKKKPKKVARPKVAVPEVPVENPRITEMREATQQIVFIDSVVVDKDGLLAAILLNPESGRLSTYDSFFHSKGHADAYAYINEMGNKCYFAMENADGKKRLYTSDRLDKEWSEPMALDGIGDDITEANYPFMMSDGTTFYFAAKGEASIGGYDIFVTRYDARDGRFLRPENIGMPFCSEANDYLYVIDEQANIGYFVTDRRQPEGKVCVYMFIPPTSRRTYSPDAYTSEQLRGFADIRRIAATWGNGKERKAALERLRHIGQSAGTTQSQPSIQFVINDQLTYTSVNQFRSPESSLLYKELADCRKKLEEVQAALDKSRSYYPNAQADDKKVLRKEILDAERQEEELAARVRLLEKKIRNAENIVINAK